MNKPVLKQKTVFALHTGFALVNPLKPIFDELLPDVRIVNVVDDSLLADVRAAGWLTPAVTRRIVGYGVLAESSGANAIFNCCSSVGEAADVLAKAVDIPVVKIDDRMASEAVELGSKIGLIGTVATTLDPTARLVQRKAEQARKAVRTEQYLVEGAFDALMSGDSGRHDSMVVEAAARVAGECDVIVLAQGSMARLVPQLDGLGIPVLSSPRPGVQALKEVLQEHD